MCHHWSLPDLAAERWFQPAILDGNPKGSNTQGQTADKSSMGPIKNLWWICRESIYLCKRWAGICHKFVSRLRWILRPGVNNAQLFTGFVWQELNQSFQGYLQSNASISYKDMTLPEKDNKRGNQPVASQWKMHHLPEKPWTGINEMDCDRSFLADCLAWAAIVHLPPFD